ncbi:molybdate ABC transporter substrate-binding protein [Rhodobacteraceae bacterium N5(2021)]|uniref:Molybdate ABC transporter substrate-binding protein n=1 Tax=Gymnodinialimonas phycosphaerae TaxID=2841589 RepID=A0A975TYI7_9RHOB|nr:molybdate ABC transporter substrate-binding protein [Gymnodinialimonas phycosphaerae]MBY4892320.1 molybdate ABC transporter substrate-binding protein [Gymnodinialimonas phycosphaerae]
MRRVLLSWLLCAVLAVPARAEDVLVFAAASLAGPLDQVAEAFEAETGHSVTISYGGSSTLARQIEAGAPADVVLLANEAWMDHLERVGALQIGTRHTLLSNSLVLIGNASEAGETTLEDLRPGPGDRLALALTEVVPAGIYARAALDTLGRWEALRPAIVETDNVRAALQLVALGAARYGIVYATDVGVEPRVRILAEIPDTLHPPIRYPVAVTVSGGEAAFRFAGALASLLARNAFTEAGFGLVEE